MTERIPHPSGLTKEPPQPTSRALPDLPAPTVYGNGRIGWPLIVQYDVHICDGETWRQDWPPIERTEDERTKAYSLIIHDLPRYDRLKSEGWLRDPRHIGSEPSEMIDERKAPGA